MTGRAERTAALDMALVRAEWPPPADGSIYLNTGSCGRKPATVLRAVNEAWERLNLNPTIATFLADETIDEARQAVAGVIGAPAANVLLTMNTTQGLQMVLQSFLLQPGDELVTTTHEHGSLRTIARYLEETRGIVVRRYEVEPLDGSEALCEGMLKLVTPRTRLVQVSQIDCLSGWRPNLELLNKALGERDIPFLVDGAHAPGHGPCSAASFPLWVGSGHKWLGAPNGTGMLYVAEKYIPQLKPAWLGDHYYLEYKNPLTHFEFPGTSDVVRWPGLKAACALVLKLGLDAVAQRQHELVDYLRAALQKVPGTFIRTPDVPGETTGIIAATWEPERVSVPHLKDWLWEQHRIWTQPDFFYGNQGKGLRLSCHIATTEQELDRLIDALKEVIE